MTLTAITRDVNDQFESCELTWLPRVDIDVGVARRQHAGYTSVLRSLGCTIINIPTQPGLADSVFIEDTALVLDEIAVMCRPGAKSRRAEVPAVEAVLKDHRRIARIRPPGTLEGGDLLRIGKIIYAGLTTRSNQDGIDQLQRLIADHGYSVRAVEVSGCLHLKSAVSLTAPGTVLVNPDWTDASNFGDYELIEVDPKEPHAANSLLVGTGLVYAASFPRTRERLLAHGIDVTEADVSELQKAEGAVTCCSLVFESGI